MSDTKIPTRLKEEFMCRLNAVDDDDVSTETWMYNLINAAKEFIREHKLRADYLVAINQYFQERNTF